MEHEPILQTGTDMVTPRYAYHKPLTVKFPDKYQEQNWIKLDIKEGLIWYTDQ
jgi:hypothetical protein